MNVQLAIMAVSTSVIISMEAIIVHATLDMPWTATTGPVQV